MIPLRDVIPSRTTPYVTVTIIVVNALVFVFELRLPLTDRARFIEAYGIVPAAVVPLSLLTSMFLHGGWLHFLGNMLYLWIFGNNIEDVMGHGRFIVFYLACGILAALSHAVTDPGSNIPMVGASGAISGVLGAYLLLYPRARVLVLIPFGFFTRIMYVPAGFVLGLWFLLQLFSGGASLGRGGGGVAWFAHVGGFVAGMALIGLFKRSDVRFFAPAHHRSSRSSRW